MSNEIKTLFGMPVKMVSGPEPKPSVVFCEFAQYANVSMDPARVRSSAIDLTDFTRCTIHAPTNATEEQVEMARLCAAESYGIRLEDVSVVRRGAV